MKKGAINSNVPTHENLERTWDSAEAVKRVRAWATKDGQLDINEYSKAFFWADGGDAPEDFKLPFADVEDGELKAVWSGVSAAMKSVVSNHSGAELTDDDSKSVYDAISKYYQSFNKDLPEFVAKTTDEPDEPEPEEDDEEPTDKMAGALYIIKASDSEEETPVYGVEAQYDVKVKVAIASTDVVDRQGERIDQNGWELKNFKRNPLLLWAHDHSKIAVGNARNIHIERVSGKPRLVFTPEFHDKTEDAKALKALYEEGWMNSFSVGFVARDFDGASNAYTKQELLEISACNVPANPEAVMLAYKSLEKAGIKKETIEKLGINKAVGKGALAEELSKEKTQEQKSMRMHQVHEIMWALCDVFYDEETALDDFNPLLTEAIGLFQKIVDGTYDPVNGDAEDYEGPIASTFIRGLDEDKLKEFVEMTEKLHMIVDKADIEPESEDNQPDPVKEQVPTSSAPISEASVRAEQSLVKVIARASDRLLQGEKSGQTQTERVKMQKVIKRAAEILSSSQRRKLEDGKTR